MEGSYLYPDVLNVVISCSLSISSESHKSSRDEYSSLNFVLIRLSKISGSEGRYII